MGVIKLLSECDLLGVEGGRKWFGGVRIICGVRKRINGKVKYHRIE